MASGVSSACQRVGRDCSGSGTVAYSVSPNTGAARTGTLTVAGQPFTVNQAASCAYSLSATSASAAAGGGSGALNVTAAAGCSWTAQSNAAWITVASGASGSGNGTVSYSVSANTGAARSGTLDRCRANLHHQSGCRRRHVHQFAELRRAQALSPAADPERSMSPPRPVARGPPRATLRGSPSPVAQAAAATARSATRSAANTGAARKRHADGRGQTFTINQAAVVVTVRIR